MRIPGGHRRPEVAEKYNFQLPRERVRAPRRSEARTRARADDPLRRGPAVPFSFFIGHPRSHPRPSFPRVTLNGQPLIPPPPRHVAPLPPPRRSSAPPPRDARRAAPAAFVFLYFPVFPGGPCRTHGGGGNGDDDDGRRCVCVARNK